MTDDRSTLDEVLPSAQGLDQSPNSLRGRSGYLVVIFMSVNCPYAKEYFSIVEGFSRAFLSFGFVLVNSNSTTVEDDESVRAMAQAYGKLSVPFLRDEEGKLMTHLGATTTPEAFIIGPDDNILFHGCIDDRYDSPDRFDETTPNAGRWPWDGPGRLSEGGDHLQRALKQLLHTGKITPGKNPAVGCSIYRG